MWDLLVGVEQYNSDANRTEATVFGFEEKAVGQMRR